MQELVDQSNLGQNPPPVIFIDSRTTAVDGPEEISKALGDQITSRSNLLKLSKFPDLLERILKQVSGSAKVEETSTGDVWFNLAKLAELFRKDERDLAKTIEKMLIVFTSMASMPRKPVLIIGRVVFENF